VGRPVSWRDLLATGPEHRVLPWLGGRELTDGPRRWTIDGPLPDEHGWCTFAVDTARKARFVAAAEPEPGWDDARVRRRGWMVGGRLVPDDVALVTDPERFVAQTLVVALVPPALPRFQRARVAQVGAAWVFAGEEFPLGPEDAVVTAFTEGPADVSAVPGVPPALELALRFAVDQREHAARRRQEARERRAREAQDQLRAERRARGEELLHEALAVSGAKLVDQRPGWQPGELVVTFRFRGRRFECVVDADLRIVDAGICLNDYEHGTKGDTLFTLASLPAVIDEALRTHQLVVFRHAEGE
jgi:hypothetical protein